MYEETAKPCSNFAVPTLILFSRVLTKLPVQETLMEVTNMRQSCSRAFDASRGFKVGLCTCCASGKTLVLPSVLCS